MDRFIVGTGRCGSTLLSRMLAEHHAVLSLFELFNGIDGARRFAPAPIPGAELAKLVAAEQPFVTAVLRRGYRGSPRRARGVARADRALLRIAAGSRLDPGMALLGRIQK